MALNLTLGWLLVFVITLFVSLTVMELALGGVQSIGRAFLVSSAVASASIYLWLVRKTGCPHCAIPLPLQRREERRRLVYTEPRTVVSRDWTERRERVSLLIYGIYEVHYRCRRYGHRWEESESKVIERYPPVDRRIPPDVEPPQDPTL